MVAGMDTNPTDALLEANPSLLEVLIANRVVTAPDSRPDGTHYWLTPGGVALFGPLVDHAREVAWLTGP